MCPDAELVFVFRNGKEAHLNKAASIVEDILQL
jgi:hypothetical protein